MTRFEKLSPEELLQEFKYIREIWCHAIDVRIAYLKWFIARLDRKEVAK